MKCLEQKLGKKAKIEMKPIKAGDIKSTSADITKSKKLLGYNPQINLDKGLGFFIKWYVDFYKIKNIR